MRLHYNFSLFESVKDQEPKGVTNLSEVLQKVRECPYLKNATERIQRTHHTGILDGFQSIPKGSYQADKAAILTAILPSATIATRNGDIEATGLIPSGLLCLDIDENDPETLRSFHQQISGGKYPVALAAFRSVSGALNGSFTLFMGVELPTSFEGIPKALTALLGLSPDDAFELTLQKLHNAYYQWAADDLREKKGISVGKSGSNLKHLRYLSHDPQAYHNPDARVLKMDEIVHLLKNRKPKAKPVSMPTDGNGSWIGLCDHFARSKGFELVDGQKHDYLNRFSIAANLYGIPQDSVEEYVTAKGLHVTTNCIEYVYKQYSDKHGSWAYLLRPAPKKYHLAKGEKLSKYGEQIARLIVEKHRSGERPRFEIKSGTGTGKTYATIKVVAPYLLKETGFKTVIFVPLNTIVEKQAESHGIPYVTGDIADLTTALDSDVVICNYNSAQKLIREIEQSGERYHCFIDEAHELIAGMHYKRDVVTKLYNGLETMAASLTLVTATPKPYFGAMGFERIEVTSERAPIAMKLISFKGKTDKAALQHILSHSKPETITMVRLQSKKQIERLREALIGTYGYTDEQIVRLYSADHIKKSDSYEVFRNAKEGGDSFAESVRVVLVTSFIECGVDIYSTKPVEVAYFENNHYHNTESVVQSLDRWRTDKAKTAYYYYRPDTLQSRIERLEGIISTEPDSKHLGTRKEKLEKLRAVERIRQWDFKPNRSFLYELNEWEQAAESNSRKIKTYGGQSLFNLRTSINDNRFLIISDNSKECRADILAIAKSVDDTKQKRTTIDQLQKELSEHYPYFQISNGDQLEDDPEATEVLKEAERENRQRDMENHSLIHELLRGDDKEPFLQAVRLRTSDEKYRRLVRPKRGYNERAKELIQSYPVLFGQYVPDAVTAWKRINSVQEYLLSLKSAFTIAFVAKGDYQVLRPNRGYGNILDGLKLMLLEHLKKSTPKLLGYSDNKNAERYQMLRDRLEEQSGKDLSSSEIKKLFRDVFGRNLKGKTERQCVSIFKALYTTKRINGKYRIVCRKTLQSWCDENNVTYCEIRDKLRLLRRENVDTLGISIS